MNEVKKRVGGETWVCYKSDAWSCTGDFDWGSPLAEQKVWNKGITTYLIFKAREGEAYFISWAIGIWLISMLESVQYFSRHQKTCWAESSVPSSGRHVASVLHKTGIYFSCSAYCKLQSMTTLNQILNHRSGQAVVLSMALNGECERSIEWESQFRAHLRNSHPGQCWLAGQKLPIDDSHWIWKGICRKLENGTVLAFRNVFGTEITSSSQQWFLSSVQCLALEA